MSAFLVLFYQKERNQWKDKKDLKFLVRMPIDIGTE